MKKTTKIKVSVGGSSASSKITTASSGMRTTVSGMKIKLKGQTS